MFLQLITIMNVEVESTCEVINSKAQGSGVLLVVVLIMR